jgi:hypothetical protein
MCFLLCRLQGNGRFRMPAAPGVALHAAGVERAGSGLTIAGAGVLVDRDVAEDVRRR